MFSCYIFVKDLTKKFLHHTIRKGYTYMYIIYCIPNLCKYMCRFIDTSISILWKVKLLDMDWICLLCAELFQGIQKLPAANTIQCSTGRTRHAWWLLLNTFICRNLYLPYSIYRRHTLRKVKTGRFLQREFFL